MPDLDYAETQSLIVELVKSSEDYYNGVEPELTDEEFDSKIDFLENHVSTYPDLFEAGTSGFDLLEGKPGLGAKSPTKDRVTRTVPMLSLSKAKTREQLDQFIGRLKKSGAESFKVQAKLDGTAMSVIYDHDGIKQISSRGDGLVGQDLTYLHNADQVTVHGLPDHFDGELRGELFFTEDQFAEVDRQQLEATGERFKNSRNAAAGLVNRAKKGTPYPVEFTFAAYSALDSSGEPSDLTKTPDEIITVDHLSATHYEMKLHDLDANELRTTIDAIGDLDSLSIPTDGVVIKPVAEIEMLKSMGSTSHHPLSQIAYKYPTPTADTKVIGIDVTVGSTGRLTPVARLEPTKLSGTTISNISLHNFNWVDVLDVRIGSLVTITRVNDVIPQVTAVVFNDDSATALPVPTTCPVCDDVLEHDDKVYPPKTLRCANTDCESRNRYVLKSVVGRNFLDVDGLSTVMLDHLFDTGRVRDPADLFTLTTAELEDEPLGYTDEGTPRKFGRKRAENVIAHIEIAKTHPLPRLLASLGIEALGQTSSKKLVKAFGNIAAIRSATVSDLDSVEGFGAIKAEKIVNGLSLKSAMIDRMIENGVVFDDDEDSGEKRLQGLSFSMSGSVPEGFSNRNELVEFIESEGGEFHSSPKSSTSYMIADAEGTSSKVKKAKSNGTEFLSSEGFTKLLE